METNSTDAVLQLRPSMYGLKQRTEPEDSLSMIFSIYSLRSSRYCVQFKSRSNI